MWYLREEDVADLVQVDLRSKYSNYALLPLFVEHDVSRGAAEQLPPRAGVTLSMT